MNSYFSEDLIKKAIARKLKHCLAIESGDTIIYPIVFADKINQGAVEPFFLISVIDVTQRKSIGNTYWRTYQMKVEYYIDELETSRITDLRIMGERLLGILDSINLEYAQIDNNSVTRLLRCDKDKLNFQIVENVLCFFCTYNVKVKQDMPEGTKMTKLEMEDY